MDIKIVTVTIAICIDGVDCSHKCPHYIWPDKCHLFGEVGWSGIHGFEFVNIDYHGSRIIRHRDCFNATVNAGVKILLNGA